MPTEKQNTPAANTLMNSMRSMGYSFNAAIADIIDNSISAHATRIDILFPISPDSLYLAICDNGCGMNSEELEDAMKYGSNLKGDIRDSDDLGRYGLGMKSASLSQCRKMTAISKKEGTVTAFSWDLDLVEERKDWIMTSYYPEEIKTIKHNDYLDELNSGTVVLWECFDFLQKNEGDVYLGLSKAQESLSKYLELIFHRFLNRDDGKSIEMWINNYKLVPLDPFLEKHKKTNIRRKISIPIADSSGVERIVTAQPFILPFQKDMNKEDKKLVGGMEDYRTKQGFYIYRNERLIIWGTWFGRPKDELTKHARIKVDIPNTLDDIWALDIKKQTATIPNTIKRQLTKAVDEAMDIAIKVQTYRGTTVNTVLNPIWNRIIDEHTDSYRYEINRDSQIFDLIKNDIPDEMWQKLDMILEEIERSVPYQQIYIDKSQNKIDESTNEKERIEEIYLKAKMLINISKQINPDRSDIEIIDEVFSSDPFSKFTDVKERIAQEVSN